MVWKEENPPSHGPCNKWTKPRLPAYTLAGWSAPPKPLTQVPGPNAYTVPTACVRQVESRKRSSPAYYFGYQCTVEVKPVNVYVRTTEVTATSVSSIGTQAVSTARTAPAFSMSHRLSDMFGVSPSKRTPGPSDYGSVTAGLSQSPVLRHAPTVHFPRSIRDVGGSGRNISTPGPDRYDANQSIRVVKLNEPSYSMGRRPKEEGVCLTARSNSYRTDSSLGEQRVSMRKTMPSVGFGSGGRRPLPGLAGWNNRAPGPGAYG